MFFFQNQKFKNKHLKIIFFNLKKFITKFSKYKLDEKKES